MAKQTNRVEWEFLLNQRQLDAGLKKTQRGMQQTKTSTDTLKKAFGALGLAIGAREVFQFGFDAVQLAVAANEVDARFQAVFGSAIEFRDALESWGDMAGVTKTRAEDLASSFGNLAQTQGLTAEASADFALKTAKLAGDIASFKDLDPELVFEALNKGLLTTEKEGLKAFDLAITAAEVDTRALIIATKDNRTEISKADKAYASYEIAVEQAGKAIGDLEATQDSAANQQRQLTASIEEQKEAIGRELLPVYKDLLELTVQIAPAMTFAAEAVGFMASELGTFTTGIVGATDETASFSEKNSAAIDSIVSLGKSMLRFNPITGSTVILLEQLKDESEGIKVGLDKATKAVKPLTQALAAGDDELIAYGQALGGLADEAESAADALDRTAAASRRIIAAKIEFLELRNIFSGSGPEGAFASGGTVPGPVGAPMTATVHGGEEILTPSQQRSSSGGGGTVVNIFVEALDPDAAAVAVADALRSYEDRFGSIR
jgi:hypothetical protein